MRLLLSPMVISMTDKKHLSSASQEKLSSYSSASKNATSNSNTSAKNNLKRTISTASPQGAEDEDKRPQPKRRKSTGAEVPHGPGSSSRKVAAPRPMPLSERQQLALLMQMTAAESQQSESDRLTALPSSAHKRSTAKVEKRNERGETALHIASKRGDVAEVKKLINAGANVNVTDYAGWTALHEACNRGHQTIARLLLNAGANVNVQGMDNDTPLHDAATSGHCKLVQLLLRHGANPSQCNKQGKSPLDLASGTEVLRLLRSELITSASSCSSESLLEPRSPTSPESTGDDDRPLTTPTKGSMAVTPAKVESRTPSTGGVPQLSSQSMWPSSLANVKVDDGGPQCQSTQLSPRLSVDSNSSQHYQSHGHSDQSSPRLTLKICRKESTSSESNVMAKQNSYSVTLASSKDKDRLDSSLSPAGNLSSDDSGDAVKFKPSNSSISFLGSKSHQQQQRREDVTRDSTEANASSSADKILNSPRLPQSSSGIKGASITKGTSGKSASTRDSGRTESDSAARPAFSSSSSLSSMPVIGGSSSTSVISSVRSSESVSRTLAATQYTYGASSLSRTHHAPVVSMPSWLNGGSGGDSSSGSSGSSMKARVPLTSGTSQTISSSSLYAAANHSVRSSSQGHGNVKNKDMPAVGSLSLHSMQRAEKSPYSVGGMTTHAKPPQQPPATGASITFRNGAAPIPAYPPPHHNSTTSASFQSKVTNGRSNTAMQHSSTPVTHAPKQQSPLLASFEDISDSEDDQQQSAGKSSKSVSKPLSFAMSSGPASSISTPPSSHVVRHTTTPSSYGSNNSSLSRASLPLSAASQNNSAMLSGSANGLKPLLDMNASKPGQNGVRMSLSVDNYKASLAWSTISSDKPMYQRSGNWTSTNGGHGSRGVPSDGKSPSLVPSLPSSANASIMKLAGMSEDLTRKTGIPVLPDNSGLATSVIVGSSSLRENAVNKLTAPLSALDSKPSLNSVPTLPYSSQKVPSSIIPSSVTALSSVALQKTNGGPPALYVGREADKTITPVNVDPKHAEINNSSKVRLNRGIPEPNGPQASLLQSQSAEDIVAKRRKFESTSEMKPQVLNATTDVQQQQAFVRSSTPPLLLISNGPTSAGSQQTSLPGESVAKVEFPSATVDVPSKTPADVSKQLLEVQVIQKSSPAIFDSKDKDGFVRDNRVTSLAASKSPAAASLPAIQEKVDGRLPGTNSSSESSLQSFGKVSITATVASSSEDATFHSKIGQAKLQDPVSTSALDKIAVGVAQKATAAEKTATTDFSPSNLAITKEKVTEEGIKTLQLSPTAHEDTARDVKKEVSGEVAMEACSKQEDDDEEQQSSRPATPKVPPIRIILSGAHNVDKESKDVPGKHALPYVVNTMDRTSLPGSASPTGKVLPLGEGDEQLDDEKSRTRGEGDKMADFEDEAGMGKATVGERRVTRSALRAQREKKQLGGKTGSTDIKTVGEEQSSEKDAVTINEVSEELPVHPRKRKLTRARIINNEPADLVVPIEPPVDSHNLYIIDKQDNPYRSVRDLKKKMMQRHSQLLETPFNLKAPDDFKSYLLSSRNYLLSGKPVPLMPRSAPSTPPTVPLSLQTLYSKQEYQRQQLERQHVVEKEKVVLAMEMQLLREHARGYVETSAGGLRSLSFCSLMRDQGNLCSNGRSVEEARASTRSHSSSRDLLRWKKEVLDKFDKIKADVCGRQRFEAEALQASQRLEWECMLVQNHLCDSRTVPQVDALCVPMASVDDEFIVSRQVLRRTV